MAPKAEGFNLWGYLLPGSAILVAGAALVAVLSRRRAAVAGAGAPETREPQANVGRPEPMSTSASASPEEMERLRRALAEVED